MARYGGEEFAVLLPDTGPDEAEQIARHLVSEVRSCHITYDNREIPVTISAGFATCPDHGQTERQLVAAADSALYHAKQSGRNRACSADEVTVAPASARGVETGSPTWTVPHRPPLCQPGSDTGASVSGTIATTVPRDRAPEIPATAPAIRELVFISPSPRRDHVFSSPHPCGPR